jgi:tetratricopeptide (TPR) repeat protein
LQAQGLQEQALAICREGVERLPAHARLRYALAQLQREACLFDEAAGNYETAFSAGFASEELFQNLADAYIESGRVELALAAYDRGLRSFPRSRLIHRLRARTLWEADAPTDPLQALWQAARDAGQDTGLWETLLEALHHLKRQEDIGRALDEAREAGCARSPVLGQLEAAWLASSGHPDRAGRLLEELLSAYGNHDGLTLAAAEHALGHGDLRRTEQLCQQVLRHDPHCQFALALLGTAWQLLGDPRESWLLDYERMVLPQFVEAPGGWADARTFFADVAEVLGRLHRMRSHPIDQTLRGGTQTNGYLFRMKEPVIAALEASIRDALAGVLAAFPFEQGHPFWGRRTAGGAFRFSGAWSVRLQAQGFHTNHMHPQGWISSALYIELPDELGKGTGDEGCLQFGVPPIETGLNLPARRVVRPEVGLLTLFPSYMWHGTIPFDSPRSRLTVAFDIVPEPQA